MLKKKDKMKTIVYKLRLDEEDYLGFEYHGDGIYIFIITDSERAATFKTKDEAVAAIGEPLCFHHGLDSRISPNDSIKDRFEKIKIVKETHIIEKVEEDVSDLYLPTNIEVHEYYCKSRDDIGLRQHLKSSYPNAIPSSLPYTYVEDDGYEFISNYFYRVVGYNKWVAAGKPLNPKLSDHVLEEIAARFKEDSNV